MITYLFVKYLICYEIFNYTKNKDYHSNVENKKCLKIIL
jgi:hypothetical protein